MTGAVARLAAFTFVFLLVAGAATLYVTSRGAPGTEVQAEFEDAFGLLEGLDVRIGAAPAGSVNDVELTDRGTALVTMTLFDGVEPPRADAAVSVRQQDLLGDTYVAFSLGDAEEQLEGPIPPSRAVAAPRLDAILSTFRKPVREALGLLIVESGTALDRRGEDLNGALVQVRPALAATTDLMAELDASNDGLRSLIRDAERVTTQAARRSSDLGPSIDSLARLLRTTADRSAALGRGLEVLPQTLSETRGTLDRLTRVTESATPTAVALRDVAPRLQTTAKLARPFVDDARAVADDLDPTLDLAATALAAGEPTLEKLVAAVPEVGRLSPSLDDLLDALLPARKDLVDGYFGAQSFGKDPNEVGLGAASVEPGRTPGFDPARRLLRTEAVLSCETFGVKIESGCLEGVLDGLAAPKSAGRSARSSERASTDRDAAQRRSDGGSEQDRETVPAPDSPADAEERPDSGGVLPESADALLDFLLGS